MINFTVKSPTAYLLQTGETPASPTVAFPGYDGYAYFGIPWSYVTSGTTIPEQRFIAGTGLESDCITDESRFY